jgi:hypothetical protein
MAPRSLTAFAGPDHLAGATTPSALVMIAATITFYADERHNHH